MGTLIHTTRLGLLCGALLTPATLSAPELLAPPYPGAVADSAATNSYQATFLTQDPIEKVQAFYQERVGTLHDAMDSSIRDNDAGLLMCPKNSSTICLGKILMRQGQVAQYLVMVTDAYDAGVKLIAQRRETPAAKAAAPGTAAQSPQQAEVARMMAEIEAAQAKLLAETAEVIGMDPDKVNRINQMSDLFDGPKEEVAAQRHSPDELLQLYARYQHLETAVYPYVKENGNLVSYDRWLLAQKRQTLGAKPSAAEQEQMMKQLQELYMARKMDEAQKLTDRMMAGSRTDRWNDWVNFLKDLDAHAYKTRIVISVDPRSWGRKR